jgi:diguanylate cyclase (GGDEF)-like protein
VALREGRRIEGSFKMVGLTMALSIIGLVARGVHALLDPAAHADPMHSGLAGGLTFLLGFMGLLSTGFGFVLAYLERMASQMKALASRDGLTGCLNHNTTLELLAHTLDRARREHAETAVILLDIDHFKRVNDRHGHGVGDQVLRAFADTVRGRLRASDVLGRLGGEEFAVLLPGTDQAGALRLAELIRQAIEALVLRGDAGMPLRITVSAGVAVQQPQRDWTAQQLVDLSDKALYRAKQNGRNQVVLGDEWMLQSSMSALLD